MFFPEVIHFVVSNFDCSTFSPLFTYGYDGRYLNVNFTKGPDECQYLRYEVAVHRNTSGNIVAKVVVLTQDNVVKLQTTFEPNICKGYYFLMVGVHRNENDSCPCKDRQQRCRSCTYGRSTPKYFIPARSCSQKSATPEKPKESHTLLSYFRIIIGLLLLIALALFITYWKLSVGLMASKRGIVLFLDDHEHHINAVTKLAKYLNKCHLRVSLASVFLKNPDIPNQLAVLSEALKSDSILLVLSEALQKRMAVWEKQQDYVEFFKEENSNILTKPFLEILLGSNKLYVCKFDHVAEFGHWPKPCYSLPTDLTRMTTDLNGQSFSQRMILCNCRKSNSIYDELHEEIQKALLYEQSYKNWFQEKYVCPRNVEDSHFVVDETSRTESLDPTEYVSVQKLKDIFAIYRDRFTELPNDPIITERISSEGVGQNLEEINARNLQL